MIPRDYQEFAVQGIFDYFSSHPVGNPLIAMPTGTGKSPVIAWFMERALKWYPNTRILVLTHVKELIEQNFKTFKRVWPNSPAGIYSSGLKKKESHLPITFAGIASIFRRSQLFGHIDLIIIDEAHLVSDSDSAMYMEFIMKMKVINPSIRIIGLTATTWRTGMGSLTNGRIFNDIAVDLTTVECFNWFIAQGWLKPLVPRPMNTEFDIGRVSTSNTGEYNLGELQDAVDKQPINEAAITEIMHYGSNRQAWLIFASGVDHAIHLGQILDSRGVRNTVVHSRMADTDRDKAIDGFKTGIYQAIVNNGILTTGFDHPAIDLIAMLRPTKSSSLWVQMLGRGTRPCATAADCLVLDFARNTPRLGPINDPVLPKQRGQGGGGGMAPVKVCPGCGNYIHASLTICNYCGTEIPRELKISDEAGTQALIKKNSDNSPPVPQKILETFNVTKVTYGCHKKIGKPDSLKVTYYTTNKYQRFEEWVCPEHLKIRGRASQWWRARSNSPLPDTTAEALECVEELSIPETITVRMDSNWKEVVGYGTMIEKEYR